MCRFQASRNPPATLPSSPEDAVGFGQVFLDDFNWFDAIDELPEEVAAEQAAWGPSAASSDSQDSCVPSPQAEGDSKALPIERAANGEFDLLQFFANQLQVEKGGQVPGVDQQMVQPAENPPLQYEAPQEAVALKEEEPAMQYAPALPASAPATATNLVPEQQVLAMPQAMLAQVMQAGMAPGYAYPGPWMGMSTVCSKPAQQVDMEPDDPTERLKRKRRESAQRSRARKNAYMKQLEAENKALKEEVTRLKDALCKLQPQIAAHCAGQYSSMMTGV